MNEVTPDLIAQIATRLYNEIPGANRVPKTEAEASNVAPGAAVWPAEFARVPSVATPVPADPETTGTRTASGDGLSAFVQRIRTAPLRSADGRCADGRDQDLRHRLFAGRKAAPAQEARPLDVPAIRKDFPALDQKVHGKPLAWLDNAATTQKPQSVIDALSRFYARDNSNIHRGAHTLAARATDAFEQAR